MGTGFGKHSAKALKSSWKSLVRRVSGGSDEPSWNLLMFVARFAAHAQTRTGARKRCQVGPEPSQVRVQRLIVLRRVGLELVKTATSQRRWQTVLKCSAHNVPFLALTNAQLMRVNIF
jgi:hypothetical protein